MILVTGGTGFVGASVLERLAREGNTLLRAAVRRPEAIVPDGVMKIVVSELSTQTDWSAALHDVTAVVHCAARVHIMDDTAADPLTEFRRVNVEGTMHLARQAAAAGVRRFVFVSSIKVNGEMTVPGSAFKADDIPAPADAYGISKLEAEQGLRLLAQETGMELVIIRPPLIYGAGVRANFAAMMRWLARGVPLPLGAIDNRRSLVALDNIVDLIVTCLHHPAAVGQIFLVSDGEDTSTTQLLRRMGKAMGRPVYLLPVPAVLLQLAARLVGKKNVAQRLCSSLQVDIQKTRQLLSWTPPLTLDQGLQKAAKGMFHEKTV